MDRIERELRELIDRHEYEDGSVNVAVAELRNVLEPGSAPMYPATFGYTATCGICMPDGDGVSKRRDQRPSGTQG